MPFLSSPLMAVAMWVAGMVVGGAVGWWAGAATRAALQTEVNGLRSQRQSGDGAILDRRYADLVKARDLALEALATVDRARGRTFETGAGHGQGD